MKTPTEMIQNNRAKLLLLIIAVLTLINVAAVITVVVSIRSYSREAVPQPFPPPAGDDSLSQAPGPALLIRELGFDPQQQDEFRESRRQFRDDAGPLFKEIRDLNAMLIEEIIRENPDTASLNAISHRIGNLQARVKLLTIRHLRQVRSIATPGQRPQLETFYRDLLSRDATPVQPGMQNRYRHGRNNRNHN